MNHKLNVLFKHLLSSLTVDEWKELRKLLDAAILGTKFRPPDDQFGMVLTGTELKGYVKRDYKTVQKLLRAGLDQAALPIVEEHTNPLYSKLLVNDWLHGIDIRGAKW